MTTAPPATAAQAGDGTTGPTGARRRRRRVPPRAWPALLAVVLVVAVLVRLRSASVLWLDEALSVEISRRPVPDLLDALRRDGSPPLYYLLLHAWMEVFGESATATRALSTVFSLLTLPVVWLAGRRLGGAPAAWAATLLVAVSPFAVRYATETRMYALVQLLSALGVLCVLRALERPSALRLLPVALLSGAIALTHYWGLFLLAATGLVLLGLSLRGDARRAARRTLLALVAGGVLFLPWLPDFLFQVSRTGTPWAAEPTFADVYSTVVVWTGAGSEASIVLALLVLSLVLLAVAGHRLADGVRVGRPVHRTPLLVLAAGGGSLVLGVLAGIVVGAGFAPRYSSVALVPVLLVAAVGLRALPERARRVALVVVAVTGLAGVVGQPAQTTRTQAGLTAAALERQLMPGDVVVYCPDQLGPAISRRLPATADQVVYPTFDDPALVDWVDYAERNEDANPFRFARTLDTRTEGAVFVVWSPGYRTFDRQCEALNETLRGLRGTPTSVLRPQGGYGEQSTVERYPARTSTGR